MLLVESTKFIISKSEFLLDIAGEFLTEPLQRELTTRTDSSSKKGTPENLAAYTSNAFDSASWGLAKAPAILGFVSSYCPSTSAKGWYDITYKRWKEDLTVIAFQPRLKAEMVRPEH